MKAYLAIDIGASSGRLIAGYLDQGQLKMEELHRFKNGMVEIDGHMGWDIDSIFSELLTALKKAHDKGLEVQSIGIDTWGVDFAIFGRDGELLRLPYCYRDPHTTGAPEELFKRMSRNMLYKKTGIQIMDFNTVFQIDTLRRNGCAALEAARKLMFIPDALAYLLTGETATEYTIASTAQMIDPRTRTWDTDILRMLGLTSTDFGLTTRTNSQEDATGTENQFHSDMTERT